MRKIVGCLILLLLFSFYASAASYDPALTWQTIKTDHFLINYDKKLEPQVQKIANYLEEAYTVLTQKMNWTPWLRTEVVVTDNNDVSNGLSSVLPYNWMQLRLTAPDPDSILGDYDNWLRTLCFHEYTHIIHLDQHGGALSVPRMILGKVIAPNATMPGWLREGMPTYFETVQTKHGRGEATYSDMMLRTAILEDKFLAIDQADGLGWKWPSYQSMYIYGVKFMQYLSNRYGEEKLSLFHNRVARSPMLFAANHQAKWVFNDIKFDKVKNHNHYSLVKKLGEPKAENFYDLWADWKEDLTQKYTAQKVKVEKEGLTEFKEVAAGGTVLSSPAISPDGKYLAYARSRVKGPSELHMVGLETGADYVIKRKGLANSIAFSPDGKKLLISVNEAYKTYNLFSDLFVYDINYEKLFKVKSKEFVKITDGARASDGVFSPDGKKVLFVRQNIGESWLAVMDLESKEITDLKFENSDQITQVANPAWYGNKIAFAGHVGKNWNIFTAEISDAKSQIKNLRQLTDDDALETRPKFSPDGKEVYFVSDKTGISNIYKISTEGKKPQRKRITNVLTGVFEPAISPDGKRAFIQYYNGDGYDIRSFETGETKDFRIEQPSKDYSSLSDKQHLEQDDSMMQKFTPKKYVPLGKSLFLPRFLIPTFGTLDGAVYAGAFTGGTDALNWHNWTAGINWRSDYSSYLGYFFNYWYNRYRPMFNLGVAAYPVRFAKYTFTTGETKVLFEKRTRAYGGMSLPYGKHAFGVNYFFEDWKSNFSDAEIADLQWQQDWWRLRGYNYTLVPKLGRYSGFGFQYLYGDATRYAASISSEHGRKVRMGFTVTSKKLGATDGMQQEVFAGDYREYISLPWRNVIAFRTAGGITWGDQFSQGTFSLGGSLGEGLMGGGDSLYYFPLRGIPVATLPGTRALLFSLEYRFPIVSLQRGLGTFPFYVKEIHFAPFADYGNTWFENENMWGEGKHFFNNFMLGVGGELRGDFILGHGLPVSGRFGYGIVVVNRSRLVSTTTDPYLGTSIKNGMLVLQLGTSF